MKTICAILMLGLSVPFVSVAQTGLKEAFAGEFMVGAALNTSVFTGTNRTEAAIVEKQFNTISPENVLKWESIHPNAGKFDFSLADQYVAFGEKHKMFIIGHNLIWHSQTPDWVFHKQDGSLVDRDTLLARMYEHISTVVGRY